MVMRNNIYYEVMYIDDYGRNHYCIASNKAELQFIQDRFVVTSYFARTN